MMRTVWLVLMLLSGAIAHAASFDCRKANTVREKAVCDSPDLNELDDQMAAAYKSVLADAPSRLIAEIRDGQRTWLHKLDTACNPKDPAYVTVIGCLEIEYTARIKALQHLILHEAGVTFIWASVELEAPASQPDPGSSGGGRPQFGHLSASWPQSAADTPDWKAWNTAIEAATVRVASLGINPPASSFREILDPDMDIDVSASIGVVGLNLVTAAIENDWDGGGIHPNEDSIQFNWLLKERRELQPEDVFRHGSGWDSYLQKQCDQYLHKTLDYDGRSYEDFMQPGEMAKTLHGIVVDPESWGIDSQGITIIFQTYAVACHACTAAPLLIRWQSVQEMLNPEFVQPKEECTARGMWDKMPSCKE
jgi:uncharacterized protein